jgi:uncharacterized caspase-like protein
MKRLLFTIFSLLLVATLAQAAQQSAKKKPKPNLTTTQSTIGGKRIALVIGNGNYQHADSLPKLANPPHDAEDIAKALRGFGFEVIEKKDQSLEGMNDVIAEFGRKIVDSDAALFYYAGHGLQVKGQNYIIPVNANIESESQVPYQSININQVLDEMDNGKSHSNIVMLDACRNNPIGGKFRSGASRGLAAPTSQPKGTVIVYATDPGNVAADGNGRNGLFTAGLLTAFKGNDLSLRGVLERASEEVERDSEQKQTPYINGPATLQKTFMFAQSQNAQVATLEPTHAGLVVSSPVTSQDIESEIWTEVQKGNSKKDYQAYQAQYPKGKYFALANSRIKKLDDEALVLPETIPNAKPLPETYLEQGGLTWMPVKFSKNWKDATAYCVSNTINGMTGWRMPTKIELLALYSALHSASANIIAQGWTLNNTWSSTEIDGGKHLPVNLYDASSLVYGPKNDDIYYYVSCVH